MQKADGARNRRIGIGLITLATLCFAALDACAKWLVRELPVLEVVWLRFATHVLWMTLLLTPRFGAEVFRMHRPSQHLLRGAMLAAMTGLNFWALQYLQLAEVGAIQFSVPLLIALLSSFVLHEKLSLRSWVAIAAGFVGVLLVIRPGTQAFHPALGLSVLNAVLYAIFNLMTRQLTASESPMALQMTSAIVATLLMAPFALLQWQWPASASIWVGVLFTGLVGGLGHLAVAVAHRYATAAVLGPFLYQQILYMTILGWLIFNQVPDAFVVAGAAVVVCSGLYLLLHEVRQQA